MGLDSIARDAYNSNALLVGVTVRVTRNILPKVTRSVTSYFN